MSHNETQWLRYAKVRNNMGVNRVTHDQEKEYPMNLEDANTMKKTREVDRMVQLRAMVRDISRPKSERQPLMTELRNLERKLGYPSESYNGDK